MQFLDDYITRFAGYGSLTAPLWFAGMEEGGGRDIAELERRVTTWESRGSQRLEDLAGYHLALDFPRHFTPPYPLQRTWEPLCRTLAAWRGEEGSLELLRTMQREQLGASNGTATLVELMPLPAPATNVWPYADLASHRADLASRKTYNAAVMPARIAMLRSLIAEGRPQAIVMYGSAYMDSWRKLAGSGLSEVQEIEGERCFLGTSQQVTFAAVPHPSKHGLRRPFWTALGKLLRDRAG